VRSKKANTTTFRRAPLGVFAHRSVAPNDWRIAAVFGFGVPPRSHSLRMGLMTVPAALLIVLCLLPIVASNQRRSSTDSHDLADFPV
jgi:hypothetical protein